MVIVGRANVGKSTLFNRVVGAPRAVVAREEGTTRDRVSEVVQKVQDESARYFIIDTAGLKRASDHFEESIQDQILDAIDSADVIVQVVDGTTEISHEDRAVAKTAHKAKKPFYLAVNKSDMKSAISDDRFKTLGVKDIFFISASHNQGVEELRTSYEEKLELRTKHDTADITVSLIGRPNVGKSSLFNRLGAKQAVLVADQAGTTRDVSSVRLTYHGTGIDLLDTAGMRKKSRQEIGIERFSVLKTLWAIQRSDICMLVLDATEIGTHLDQKLAGEIKAAGKGLILVITKWDLIEKDETAYNETMAKVRRAFEFIPWVPVIFVSSETGEHVTQLMELVVDIQAARKRELPTGSLNSLLRKAVAAHPPSGLKKQNPRLRYIVQTDTGPPVLTIFGSNTKFIHFSYIRYLEKLIRREYDINGTPILFAFSDRDDPSKVKTIKRRKNG